MQPDPISTPDFQRLVELLTTLKAFQTPTGRDRLVASALATSGNERELIRTLDLTGGPAVVAERLLRDLSLKHCGGQWALALLARELLRRVSPDASARVVLERLAEHPGTSVPSAFDSEESDRRRIFIIHAHGSPNDDKKVRRLEAALTPDFDVAIDYSQPFVDQGWEQFSSSKYRWAHVVLIAATAEWSKRANEFLRGGDTERYAYGHGVLYELKTLILPDLWGRASRRLFIVQFDEEDRKNLPSEFRSLNRFFWQTDRKKLLELLKAPKLSGGDDAEPESNIPEHAFEFTLNADMIDAGEDSHQPVVIALQESADELTESVLPGMERHLTVTLQPDQIEHLEDVARRLGRDGLKIAEIESFGQTVWRILRQAEPRLQNLLARARSCNTVQPIAWTGYASLLLRLSRPIAIAHGSLKPNAYEFVTINGGAHYFHPLDRTAVTRNLNDRSSEHGLQARLTDAGDSNRPAAIRVETIRLSDAPAIAQAELAPARKADVAIVHGTAAAISLEHVATNLEATIDATSVTRVVLSFSDGGIDEGLLNRLLSSVPCLTLGAGALGRDDLIAVVTDVLQRAGSRQAVPCILAAVRSQWIRAALEAGDPAAFLQGVLWTTWSWIGRPLFPDDFRHLPQPAYPHLMDLRSINSSGWYHERRHDVARCYQAAELVSRDLRNEDKFHLYVSGAGGTGKSCFLRSVYDSLLERDDVLAVWHRIDAPSSDWNLVANRIRQECVAALGRKLGTKPEELEGVRGPKLHDYLRSLLRTIKPRGISDIVVFLDQLERTFESGEQPNLERLRNIAAELMELLREVKVGEGVRVYIASRKQYLPDFLHSWQDAVEAGLHFNVLQSITDRGDRKGFIDDVQHWCGREHLIDESVVIDDEAAYELAEKVGGHPLNMMLSLIQLLSEHTRGKITKPVLEKLRPWEKLFTFDGQMMARTDLDWYVLLAMAHARTEIVGLEEVWWRLRMVNPELTRQADQFGKSRVLERLWLVGHLGRTIYARQHEGDASRFLEFFHANLRDYLLRDVMSYGGVESRFYGRTGGTPPAWKALDRLWAAAHEWEQTPQLLAAEDVRAIMEHRTVAVERVRNAEGGEEHVFYLLFLRDSTEARDSLCGAARECFVYSALVHDDAGRRAFEQVFPDIESRLKCCAAWISRWREETGSRILQYLIESEMDQARSLLMKLILRDEERGSASWRHVAALLSEALLAARYRDGVLVSLAEAIGEEGLTRGARRQRFEEFAIQSCGGDLDEALSVFARCADRLKGSPRLQSQRLASMFREGAFLPAPVEQDAASPGASAGPVREVAGRLPAKLQLVRGTAVAPFVTARVEQWRHQLVEQIGIAVPPLDVSTGEVASSYLELRISGQRVAELEIHPDRIQILQRHWHARHDFKPREAEPAWDSVLREDVYWLDPQYLRQIGWDAPSLTAEEAVLRWLDEELRRNADAVVDLDGVSQFFKGIAARVDISRLFIRFSLQDLVRLLRSLVHDRVPFSSLDAQLRLLEELHDISGNSVPAEVAANLIRHHFRTELCRVYARKSAGCLYVIELEPELEELLSSSKDSGKGLRLTPAAAHALAAAALRAVNTSLRENDALPVVACAGHLRSPLLRLLRGFDPRLMVLSTDDLSSEVPSISAGQLRKRDLDTDEHRREHANG